MKRAVKFLIGQGGAGLLLDPGLGKTSISLAAIKILKSKGFLERALIVAPLKPCYLVWPKEIKKWKNFNDITYTILHGKEKEDNIKHDVTLYIINPEGLPWLVKNKNFMKTIDTLIIDESSKFKKTDTVRFCTIKDFLPKFKRRWILTGSFSPNGLLDIFGQVYIMDLGRALSPYITHFRRLYFHKPYHEDFTWVINEGAEKKISEKIKPLVLRLEAEDYLDLPELVLNNIVVDLPKKAMELYQQMEDDMVMEVESGEVITALSAAAVSMKCRQIASGGVYHLQDKDEIKRKRTWENIHDEKTTAIEDLFDEMNGRPLLVGYEFQHDLDRLLKRFGANTPYFKGGMKGQELLDLEERWNTNRIPLLLGQTQSVAHGLNLQDSDCNTVALYSLTWNFEVYDQFVKRVRRQGSKQKQIFVHHIIAENTVDEIMVPTLKDKKIVQKNFLDSLKEYVKKRGK